jgi:hypothetical protein
LPFMGVVNWVGSQRASRHKHCLQVFRSHQRGSLLSRAICSSPFCSHWWLNCQQEQQDWGRHLLKPTGQGPSFSCSPCMEGWRSLDLSSSCRRGSLCCHWKNRGPAVRRPPTLRGLKFGAKVWGQSLVPIFTPLPFLTFKEPLTGTLGDIGEREAPHNRK